MLILEEVITSRNPALVNSSQHELMRKMIAALPPESRIPIIREAIEALDDEHRQALLGSLGSLEANHQHYPIKTHQKPENRSPDRTLSPAEQKALIQRKLKQLAANQSFEIVGKAKMRRQLMGCFALVILGSLVVALLAAGGREVYDWLLKLL